MPPVMPTKRRHLGRQLSLQGVDRALERLLRREAERRGLGLNQTALELLRESLGIAGAARGRVFDDLDQLAGTWSEKEATDFEARLKEIRGAGTARQPRS